MNIWQASRSADIDRLKTLVRKSSTSGSPVAEINKQDQFGFVPIHWAVQEGHAETVKFLVENGADFNARDSDGQTPLHWAVDRGHTELIHFLVQKCKCDLNGQDKHQHTALHRASALGQTDIVKFLVDFSADVELKNQNGWTALHVACYYYHLDIVSILVEGNDVNIPNKDGWTPLHCCSMQGFADVASILLRHGANIDYQSKDGSTPLHLAAQEGKAQVVDILLKYKANTTIFNTKGKKAEGTTTEVTTILSTRPQKVIEQQSVLSQATVSGEGTQKGILSRINNFVVKVDPKYYNNNKDKDKEKDPLEFFGVFCLNGRFSSLGCKLLDPNPKNGEYNFTYEPPANTVPGKYELHVKIGADHVNGSPFELIISKDGMASLGLSFSSGSVNYEEEVKNLRDQLQTLQSEFTNLSQKNSELSKHISTSTSGNSIYSTSSFNQQQPQKNQSQNLNQSNQNEIVLKCIVCGNNQRDTVVLPCLHFAFCRNCLGGHSTCPTCDAVLCGFIKVKIV